MTVDSTTVTSHPRIDPDEPRDWFFTFGFDHTHPTTGQRLRKSFVRIHGTCDSTREQMNAAFGNRWSNQYHSAERAGVEKYGLTEASMPGADEPTIAADTAAIRRMLEQLRLCEREHGRAPSAELWDGAEALTAEIVDRLDRIDRLAAAR
jgi:hypothetical protein